MSSFQTPDRINFETQFIQEHGGPMSPIDPLTGEYEDLPVQCRWEGWQAALGFATERAATNERATDISRFIVLLRAFWLANQHLRFGQIIRGVHSITQLRANKAVLFYTDDDVLEQGLRDFVERIADGNDAKGLSIVGEEED
jgi:hypothetical protein